MKNENIFEEITNKIVSSLEKGVAPWRKNWGFVDPAQNYFSGHQYRGINSLLMLTGEYQMPFFGTFNQITKAGGKMKKGSKATKVYFSKTMYYDEQGNEVFPATYEEAQDFKKFWYIKYDNVFNMDCVEELEIRDVSKNWNRNDQIHICEEFCEQLTDKPTLKVSLSDRAFYRKSDDFLQMPFLEQFTTSEDFYLTLFHEMIHSTGHEKRLNRKTLNEVEKWGDCNYSKEELTAEIGACFLTNGFGINTPALDENSTNYIAGWLKVLKNDKKLIFEASTEAQKAVNFLINQVDRSYFFA